MRKLCGRNKGNWSVKLTQASVQFGDVTRISKIIIIIFLILIFNILIFICHTTDNNTKIIILKRTKKDEKWRGGLNETMKLMLIRPPQL